MIIGRILYGSCSYSCAVNTTFGGYKIYLKPENLESAFVAENFNTADRQIIGSFADDDWVYARYRIDATYALKLSTTLGNKLLASNIAVAISAANTLCQKARVDNSLGQYAAQYQESVQNETISAVMQYSDGLLYAARIQTGNLIILFTNTEAGDEVTNQYTPQMHIVWREAQEKPRFNALNKDAKTLYTIANAYATVKDVAIQDIGFSSVPTPRTGYFSIDLNNKSVEEFPCIQFVKSKIAKSAVNLGVYQTIEDVRDAHPDKNTMWIENCHYKIVTEDMLEDVMKELWAAPIISFDTETTGLKINFLSRDGLANELVGVCLSAKPGTGYYFPLQHKLFDNLCDGDHRLFMAKYMKELLETKPVVCHNLTYDWKVAYIYDINVNCVYDTIIAFGVTKRYEYLDYPLGLKAICHQLFGIDMFEIEDFVIADWKNTDITFADLPFDLVEHYGPADADITLRVYYWCKENKLLENYGAQRVFDLEVNFSKVVAYSEFWGYHIDVAQLPALESEIKDGMEKEEKVLKDISGHSDLNCNSSVQLTKIIYNELYPDILSSNLVSKASTSKDVLKELGDYKNQDGTPRYPFVAHILEYRKYETTYKNFLKKKDSYISPDGYVFPGVQQLGTNTGRVSIKDPNYQSYNDVVKKRVTGRPGYYIFDCDFAQIEYRVLASMSGQEALIKAFDDPDLDYHTHQAARMFSLPYAAVTKQLRQQSKGINFGLPYGMGDESLGARVFGKRTKENTAKAADLRRRFFEGQDKIENFFKVVRDGGVRNGYTETWLGRRRYYHKDKFSEGAIRRQAGNHVIQGTAADIWKMAVTRFFNRVVKEGWLGKVLFDGFIHDELMGEVSVELDPYEFIKAWREEYELVIDKFCRLYAGFGWGRSWYEAKKADYPPYFIDSLVAKAGKGIPWNGDYVKLIEDTKKDMYNYETKRVSDWLQEVPEGTILAPHIGGYLYDKLSDWWDEICEKHPEAKDYILKAKKGSDKKIASLDQAIEWFSEHEGIPYRPGAILSPDAAPTKQQDSASAVSEDFDEDAEAARLVQERNQLICQQTYSLGFFLDTVTNTVYLRYDTPAFVQAINHIVKTYGLQDGTGDVALVVMRFNNGGSVEAYAQTCKFRYADFTAIQEIVRMALKR